MLITIKQTNANFNQSFEISRDGTPLYYANTPWLNISAPFHAENVRKMTFSDTEGTEVYHTRYSISDNLREEMVPFKYLTKKGQKLNRYEIEGQYGVKGAFYTKQDGFFDSKFCIEYQGHMFLGYDIEKGQRNVIPIYDGDRQIAQITKPLASINNLDLYYLHLKDEYQHLIPILSFFTIYIDYRKYGNRGQFVAKSSNVSWSYSYGKNNKKYNPAWISREFGQEAAEQLDQAVREEVSRTKGSFKKPLLLVGLCFLIMIPLVIGLIVFLFGRMPGKDDALTAEAFTQMMEEQNFTVTDATDQIAAEDVEVAKFAAGPDYTIEFYLFSDKQQANRVFASTRAAFEEARGSYSSNRSVSFPNYSYYDQITNGNYYVISGIDRTLICCVADGDYAEEIKEMIEILGYR